jgi:hypothetical protein
MRKLYGTEPLFIFDSNDDANAPDPHYHRNALAFWTVHSLFLRRPLIHNRRSLRRNRKRRRHPEVWAT